MEYLVGQPVKVFIEDIAAEGGPIEDPATIQLAVRKPDASVDTYAAAALVHDGTGAYSKEVESAPGEEGTWAWRFDTTDPAVAKEGVFIVKPSALLSGDASWPSTGPCHLWTDRDELDRLGYDLTGIDEGLIERCVEGASDVMFQVGGRRWPGICERTVRVGSCDAPMLPLPEGGVVTWRGARTTTAWHPFGFCGGGRAVELAAPIVNIAEVRVDGDVLAPSAYMVRDWQWLVRIDGGVWPCDHRWWEDPAALEVDYSFGDAPPALGRLAATVLAHELVLAAKRSDSCRLDRRVRSVTREGVTVDFAMPGLAESLAGGNTGIPEVDLFVEAHNPAKLRREARFIL